jgi:hypothetical protein
MHLHDRVLLLTITVITLMRGCFRLPPSVTMSVSAPLPLAAEDTIARGALLSLTTLSFVDLELVPGMSHRLATALLKNRREILHCTRQTIEKKEISNFERLRRCLETVHGIGPKRATRFAAYLTDGG